MPILGIVEQRFVHSDRSLGSEVVEIPENLADLAVKSNWMARLSSTVTAREFVTTLESELESLPNVQRHLEALARDRSALLGDGPVPDALSGDYRARLFTLLVQNKDIWNACYFGQVKRREIEIGRPELNREGNDYTIETDGDGDHYVDAGKRMLPIIWSTRRQETTDVESLELAAVIAANAFTSGDSGPARTIVESIDMCTKEAELTKVLIASIRSELQKYRTLRVSAIVHNGGADPIAVRTSGVLRSNGKSVAVDLLPTLATDTYESTEALFSVDGNNEPPHVLPIVVQPGSTTSLLLEAAEPLERARCDGGSAMLSLEIMALDDDGPWFTTRTLSTTLAFDEGDQCE